MTQEIVVSEMRFQLIYQDSMELATKDQLSDRDTTNP